MMTCIVCKRAGNAKLKKKVDAYLKSDEGKRERDANISRKKSKYKRGNTDS